ncbi:hypothetical protein KA531_00650 [Candidatus Saccharibacteria bacterium]|nr:hypothetical protein [Candidatus Saccharibacteria bacterium]
MDRLNWRFFAWGFCLVSLADLLIKALAYYWDHWVAWQLDQRFNLDSELSIATWLSIVILLVISSRLFDLYQRYGIKEWLVGSIITLLMSLDEAISGHELIMELLRSGFGIEKGILYHSWIILGLPAVIIFLVYGYRFLNISKSKRLIFGAIASYLTAVIVIEAIGGAMDYQSYLYQWFTVWIEEVLEFVGLVLALAWVDRQG